MIWNILRVIVDPRNLGLLNHSHLFDPRFTAIEEYEFFARVAQKWKVDYSPLLLSKCYFDTR